MAIPKISVIVPVYNCEKYLERCIDSIIFQSFPNFELILIDDGSKDNSGYICDCFVEKDERIQVIHKKNAGVSAARNAGLDKAVGEYIMFVDSDDYISYRMLEDMISACINSDIVFSGLTFVDSRGTVIKECLSKNFIAISKNEFLLTHYEDLFKNLIVHGPYNKLIRRSILEEHHIRFDESLSICEDGLFVMDTCEKCQRFSGIQTSYYYYVQYGGNTLMYKYNQNAIQAAEKLYNARKRFVGDNSQLLCDLQKSSLSGFINFSLMIYTRSHLSFWGKYQALRESLNNICFRYLLFTSDRKDYQCLVFKYVVRLRVYFLFHIALFFRYA